ncbi:MAG: hypothetical protein HY240_09085 [Actinobacteria bacterium]|nr:hypothetical protein [Actinomycetota bacterium]
MGQFLLVLALAIGAGLAVYNVSLRLTGDEDEANGAGFLPEEQMLAGRQGSLPPGYRYAVLVPGYRSWETRAFGLLGIFLVVVAAALLLAIGVYAASHAVRVTLDSLVGSPTPSP